MQVDQKSAAKPNASNLDLSNERQGQRGANAQAAANGSVELQFDEDRLKIYYERIFPYKLMFKWLSYGKIVQRDQLALTSLDDGTHSTYFH